MTNCNCNILDDGVFVEIQAWATYALSVKPASPYTYEDIQYGVVTIKYAGETLVQMDMNNAVLDFDNGAIVWGLTQEQTGSLPVGQRVQIYFDLVAYDGERSEIDPNPMVVEVKGTGVNAPIPSEVTNE